MHKSIIDQDVELEPVYTLITKPL